MRIGCAKLYIVPGYMRRMYTQLLTADSFITFKFEFKFKFKFK